MRNAWGNPQLRGMPGGIHGERRQHRPYDTYLAMGTPFALLPHWPVATLSLQVGSLSNLLRALQLPALASLPPSGFLSLGHPSCDFCCCYCSVTMSRSLWPHGLQHPRCPVLHHLSFSSSCSLSRWCHSTTSSSAIPFSSCLQSFHVSQFFTYQFTKQHLELAQI